MQRGMGGGRCGTCTTISFTGAGGLRKTHLKTKQASSLELLPPPDKFLPYAVYVKKFGDPQKAKKRGHRVKVVNNIRGVIIPGGSTDEFWTVQKKYSKAHELQSLHHGGGENSSDDDVEKLEEKFGDI